MKITRKLIEAWISREGGWSLDQLALIGVEWPPVKGWKKRVCGNEITQDDAAAFVALKDQHLCKEI